MPNPKKPEVRPPSNDDELAAVERIVRQSLSFPPLATYDWAGLFGHENLRIAIVDQEIVGALGLIFKGQWFGGRAVPMVGISAVGVLPHMRSRRVASTLVLDALHDAHDKGYPLSALYPATRTVYRAQGFEMAGIRMQYEVPLLAVAVYDRELAVEPITAEDRPEIQPLYDAIAAKNNGHIARAEWNWRRVFRAFPDEPYAYVVRGETLEGYIVFSQPKYDRIRYDLNIIDLCFSTARAGRRLWSLLADHRSIARNALWWGAPADAWAQLLPDVCPRVVDRIDWMLRIVDVEQALAARGYPKGVSATVEFDVRDDVLAWNNDRFALTVTDGQGQVERGGSGKITLDVRGLASLYSGHYSLSDLVRMGLATAAGSDLAITTSVFSGPPPWMPEMF